MRNYGTSYVKNTYLEEQFGWPDAGQKNSTGKSWGVQPPKKSCQNLPNKETDVSDLQQFKHFLCRLGSNSALNTISIQFLEVVEVKTLENMWSVFCV